MLALTSPIRTWLHPLPAGAKMAALPLVAGGAMWLDRPLPLLAVLAVVTVVYLSCGWRFLRSGLRVMRPILPLVLVLGLWHLWLRAPEAGAVMVLRMLVAVAAANLVTMTTRLESMVAVLERLTKPLHRFGLRPGLIPLSVALMIRFIPVMADRVTVIGGAWRARSPRRPAWRIVPPVALAALDDAEQVSQALRARGGL